MRSRHRQRCLQDIVFRRNGGSGVDQCRVQFEEVFFRRNTIDHIVYRLSGCILPERGESGIGFHCSFRGCLVEYSPVDYAIELYEQSFLQFQQGCCHVVFGRSQQVETVCPVAVACHGGGVVAVIIEFLEGVTVDFVFRAEHVDVQRADIVFLGGGDRVAFGFRFAGSHIQFVLEGEQHFPFGSVVLSGFVGCRVHQLVLARARHQQKGGGENG